MNNAMIEDPELRRLFEAESAEHLARLDDGLLRLEKTPADPPLLEELFRESHSLKGAARMLGLAGIEVAAHGLESIFNAARKGEAPLTPETIARMNTALADLRRRVREVLADLPPPPAPAAVPPTRPAGSTLGAPTFATTAPATAPTAASEPFRIETVRVETRKLDDLLTLVGELSVIQRRMQHRRASMEELPAQWAGLERDDGARLEFIVNQMKDQVLTLRLLPLSTVFALFPRMVRDLAGERGKEAELVFEGGDLTVDKRILEEMKDPLMHLIRNAIDHGIEPPAERERLGKPRVGRVRLSAVRENASIAIEVRDDGRGLDLEAIRQMAMKRGLLDEATIKAMSPAQLQPRLQQMILLPGFSTRAFVTELSGRGVGLDVVRVNVERMKGGIRLDSAAGRGLTVQLRLPLSLATTRLLLAGVGGRLYGLPIEFVHTSLRVREAELFTLEGRPAVLLDGQPVIAARLADLLELPAPSMPGEGVIAPSRGWGEGTLACIVLQVGDERFGLLADELVAEEEVVGKPLGAPLVRVRNVSALATLGSGEICAVLNPADLLRSAHQSAAPAPTPMSPNPRSIGAC
ncbi:MAG: Hpt domain-containing protein [Rhodocyclaceae bacterium]|nr:Hpt domain-containing protein [Rhodocyclaceae bacterium]